MSACYAQCVQVPPNTSGIGTEEDSLQNVLHLVPKRPPG